MILNLVLISVTLLCLYEIFQEGKEEMVLEMEKLHKSDTRN